MKIKFPQVLSFSKTIDKNQLKHVALDYCSDQLEISTLTDSRISGYITSTSANNPNRVLIIAKNKNYDLTDFTHVILSTTDIKPPFPRELDLTNGTWLKHPLIQDNLTPTEISSSWKNNFNFIEEDRASNISGLRKPQLAALHSALSHLAVNKSTATLVMPTGTGKTETMLSILIAGQLEHLLVIVPTDALRTQIAEKFLTLGLLKPPYTNSTNPSVINPIVGILEHKFKKPSQLKMFFNNCNVVIATSNIIAGTSPELQKLIVTNCPYLFIDEAHHSEAPTWKAFKNNYNGENILQFTATPFREDGKIIDGKIIFKYSLKQAQKDGYFKPIKFVPVMEFNPNKYDLAIAKTAIATLKNDATGKHILMARVQNIPRASEVAQIYRSLYDGEVAELHSNIKTKERSQLTRSLIDGVIKVVVCVDMLGEGFDLPELKIAAFHDIKKSLAITLQLAGRFTRSRSDLGDATFIANLANIDVKDELRTLYSQDPDWNTLLPELSDKVIENQVSISKFTEEFKSYPNEIPLNSIFPATSCVIYRTDCENWKPDQFKKSLNLSSRDFLNYAINENEQTLIIIIGRDSNVDWADWDEIRNWNYELFVLTWFKESKVLVIHSSNNNGVFKSLASAVCGLNVSLIQGDQLYRSFAKIKRLKLSNVGFSETVGNLISYTGRMGNDVETGLTDVQKRRSKKSVIFGSGFENGVRTTIGASKKGRVWSFKKSNLAEFNKWSRNIANKILDENIDPNEILKGTLQAKIIYVRPSNMPINIDWPSEIYKELENYIKFNFEEEQVWIQDVSINLTKPSSAQDSELLFEISTDTSKFTFNYIISKKTLKGEADPVPIFEVKQVSGTTLSLTHPSGTETAASFFTNNPPSIWFADGSFVEGNYLTPLKEEYIPYNKEKFTIWDWSGTDLSKEAQGIKPEVDSIQYKVIQNLIREAKYDIIFDDDGSGEIADVLTIKQEIENETHILNLGLYHCKYAKAGKVSARIDDLYEVCGQAQKSIHWMHDQLKQQDIFVHLLKRKLKTKGGNSKERLIFGSQEKLFEIKELSREAKIKMHIYIVQPGVSKLQVSNSQLELLSLTEHYLYETYRIPFELICSP